MKLMRMLAVIGLLASSSLAYGQDERPVMTVNVPFAFRAAGVSLPAGHYKISRDRESQLWKLRTFGHTDIYVTATPRELRHPSPTSLLLFDLDATGYTLRQIQEKAQTGVAQLVQPNRSKEHRSAAQEVASVTALAQ
jgi:hypothetical protein